MPALLSTPTTEELDALATLQSHGAWLRVLAWLERSREELVGGVIDMDDDQPTKRGAARAMKEVLKYAASADETLREVRDRPQEVFFP